MSVLLLSPLSKPAAIFIFAFRRKPKTGLKGIPHPPPETRPLRPVDGGHFKVGDKQEAPLGTVLVADSGARHPYTAALLASIPTTAHIQSRAPLPAIEGEVLDTINVPRGCRFYARCNRVNDAVQSACQEEEPPLAVIEAGHAMRCWLFASRVIP